MEIKKLLSFLIDGAIIMLFLLEINYMTTCIIMTHFNSIVKGFKNYVVKELVKTLTVPTNNNKL